MEKKVSIIMSTYNNETTVKKSIESILSQTYNNLEFIICDDSSIDNTYKILKQYENIDDRIKVIRNLENKGGAYSKNRCIEKSSGVYIAVQDADDYSTNNRIEEEVNFLESNKEYSLVFSRAYLFDECGVWGERGLKSYSPSKFDLIKSNQFIHPTMMIRSEILKDVGGYSYSDTTYRCEDYDLWFKLYSKGLRGYILDKHLYYFREDKESYSRKKFKYRLDEIKVKLHGCRSMNMSLWYYVYAFKPLIVGIVPKNLLRRYHRLKYKK